MRRGARILERFIEHVRMLQITSVRFLYSGKKVERDRRIHCSKKPEVNQIFFFWHGHLVITLFSECLAHENYPNLVNKQVIL